MKRLNATSNIVNLKSLVLAFLLITVAQMAACAPAQKRKLGAVKFGGYRTAVLYKDKIELSGGRPFINSEDGTFRIEADKISITITALGKGKTTVSAAWAEGNVRLSAVPEPAQKIDASAAKAQYSGNEDKVVMNGNVRVSVTDPERFSKPSVLTGETAVFNLKPKAGEWRIRVEGAPGQSELTISPKTD